jgi:hypothetical protein
VIYGAHPILQQVLAAWKKCERACDVFTSGPIVGYPDKWPRVKIPR